MKLEVIEKALKANFVLTDRTDRSLTCIDSTMAQWPLYIFSNLARELDFKWDEIADYLGYFHDEVKEYYHRSRDMREQVLYAKKNKQPIDKNLNEFTRKYILVRSSINNLTKPFINEYDIYQK